MIEWIQQLAVLLIELSSLALIISGIHDIIGIANRVHYGGQEDHQNTTRSILINAVIKFSFFNLLWMIKTDTGLEYHPLYIFTNEAIQRSQGFSQAWFGAAVLISILMVIVISVGFSKIKAVGKFAYLTIYLVLVEAINSAYVTIT